MKKFASNFKQLIVIEWKILLYRFGIFVVGWYLFTLAIALYTPTMVGASQIDFTIFAFLGVFSNSKIDGAGSITNALGQYSTYLLLMYVVMMVITVIMGAINTALDFKKNKNVEKIYWYILFVIGDIISLFIIPLGVQMQFLYITDAIYANLSEKAANYLRIWIFVIAFLTYCISIALMVYCSIMPGVYNSIAEESRKLTKMSYQASRVLWDFLLIVPGVLILIIVNWDATIKLNFLINYLSFGTIFFIFLTGPIVNQILKLFNKFYNIKSKTQELYNKKPQIIV
ncbi:transmembrane protein [Spiroplasma sabaudiense Ar-1343]|uniref:Transmembrane protein n=1 Tax=Spiroplasma sabaudiense Ar-1343 TaxID=1276257 RepID=W6AIU3_9MOLU|nr:hypothetical protein [Spiroplasma sabaudiense]AHI53629.1 transmembrane protein [Spiroplasma sabaudiense Ar-1343]